MTQRVLPLFTAVFLGVSLFLASKQEAYSMEISSRGLETQTQRHLCIVATPKGEDDLQNFKKQRSDYMKSLSANYLAQKIEGSDGKETTRREELERCIQEEIKELEKEIQEGSFWYSMRRKSGDQYFSYDDLTHLHIPFDFLQNYKHFTKITEECLGMGGITIGNWYIGNKNLTSFVLEIPSEDIQKSKENEIKMIEKLINKYNEKIQKIFL